MTRRNSTNEKLTRQLSDFNNLSSRPIFLGKRYSYILSLLSFYLVLFSISYGVICLFSGDKIKKGGFNSKLYFIY